MLQRPEPLNSYTVNILHVVWNFITQVFWGLEKKSLLNVQTQWSHWSFTKAHFWQVTWGISSFNLTLFVHLMVRFGELAPHDPAGLFEPALKIACDSVCLWSLETTLMMIGAWQPNFPLSTFYNVYHTCKRGWGDKRVVLAAAIHSHTSSYCFSLFLILSSLSLSLSSLQPLFVISLSLSLSHIQRFSHGC